MAAQGKMNTKKYLKRNGVKPEKVKKTDKKKANKILKSKEKK